MSNVVTKQNPSNIVNLEVQRMISLNVIKILQTLRKEILVI